MTEIERKQTQIHALLERRGLDALLLQRVSSFAWATAGGAAHVNTADSHGIASLLFTPNGRYLLTNNIEAERLEHEEGLGGQGWEFRIAPWHAASAAVAELTRGLRLGADGPYPGAADLSADLARLRAALGPEEAQRFRDLGRLCAAAMDDAIRAVRPGQTEYEIAGLLAQAAESRGAPAIVDLVASDERVFKVRHPLPTGRQLERYAMLVLCGRRHGLVCSITRLVHFGRLPDHLRRIAAAVSRVDAAMIQATRPGATLGGIFERAVAAYAQAGFPDEWRLHHQGGTAGYEPREAFATPGSTERVAEGQAFAWNPSITGAKSEDTILVTGGGNETLTAIPGWPIEPVEVDGHRLDRPAILEIT